MIWMLVYVVLALVALLVVMSLIGLTSPTPAASDRSASTASAITYVIDEDTSPTAGAPGRLVTRIADDKLPFGGRWILTVAPADGGARLTVTEDGIVKNPLFRFLSRTVFSLTATMEHYLRALGTHLGADVTALPAEPIR